MVAILINAKTAGGAAMAAYVQKAIIDGILQMCSLPLLLLSSTRIISLRRWGGVLLMAE